MEKIFKSTKGWMYNVVGKNINAKYKNGLVLVDDTINKGNSITLSSFIDSDSSKVVLDNNKDLISFKKEFYGFLYTTKFG